MIAEGVKKWRVRHKQRRATRKGKGMAVNTGLRSSSNSAIAAVLVNVVIAVVHGLWPDFTIPGEWITYLTAGAMYLVGRFTKTPEGPGVL